MNYQEDLFQEETIDVKEILYKVWRHWEYFAVIIVLAMGIVYYVNKLQPVIYEASTTILINDNKSAIDPQALLGFDFYESKSKIQNEIELLKSHTLLEEVFNTLDLNVSYFQSSNFNSVELYKNSPFTVILDSTWVQPINFPIHVTLISSDSFRIELPNETIQLYNFKNKNTSDIRTIPESIVYVKPGQAVKTANYNFSIQLTDMYMPEKHNDVDFHFIFNSFQMKLHEFANVNFEIVDKSSVIKISLTHSNLSKAVDFLNELTAIFLQKELDRKNIVADKSLHFIETHLAEINDSLNLSEKSLQEYQSNESALNIDFQTQNMFEQLEKLQNQMAEILIQEKYYHYLKQTLQENITQTNIIAPSLMNVNNAFLSAQIANLIEIQSELNNLKVNAEKKNPYVNSLLSRIEGSKSVILENIRNENKNIEITKLDIGKRIDAILGKINLLPKTQGELFNFERSFKVYDNIYTFLLQKRSETLLAKASNVPLNEIIDRARISNYKIVSKSTRLNYMIGLILGILIPGVIIYIKYFFNSKILSDKDIESASELPILGHILKYNNKETDLAFAEPKSPISESFRMFRSNLDFARKKPGSQVILVTSSMQGEGKSYISNNLACSLALNNKKTILLVFDLRKPKLYIDLPKQENGLSSYLINKCPYNEIIQPSGINNLDIIQAGSLPPNPAELISSGNTTILFKELRELYDYIIVDTPPIGIISDGLSLTKFADTTIFVVRYNYTKVKPLANILKRLQINKLENINLVANSLETGKKAYGYGYHYGKYGDYNY